MKDQSQLMGHSHILQDHQNYAVWPRLTQPLPPDNTIMFSRRPIIFSPLTATMKTKPPGRANWKANKPHKRKKFQRNDSFGASSGQEYQLANQSDWPSQNRFKGRRFHPKRKFNSRFAPFAPRNTTSFLIRAKKSGGIASLVSPCPVTPAVLPTPMFSPAREVWVDMAKEKWGVDGYGSMKGLIRLRSGSPKGDEEDEAGGTSSESDVEGERMEVERRLDHDLSRFEMIYPNSFSNDDQTSVLENRVDEQHTHISQLEEENLTLKERVFLMETELKQLRKRIQFLETDGGWQATPDSALVAPENASENFNALSGDDD